MDPNLNERFDLNEALAQVDMAHRARHHPAQHPLNPRSPEGESLLPRQTRPAGAAIPVTHPQTRLSHPP